MLKLLVIDGLVGVLMICYDIRREAVILLSIMPELPGFNNTVPEKLGFRNHPEATQWSEGRPSEYDGIASRLTIPSTVHTLHLDAVCISGAMF